MCTHTGNRHRSLCQAGEGYYGAASHARGEKAGCRPTCRHKRQEGEQTRFRQPTSHRLIKRPPDLRMDAAQNGCIRGTEDLGFGFGFSSANTISYCVTLEKCLPLSDSDCPNL